MIEETENEDENGVRGTFKPGEDIILDRDAIENLSVNNSGYRNESYLFIDNNFASNKLTSTIQPSNYATNPYYLEHNNPIY